MNKIFLFLIIAILQASTAFPGGIVVTYDIPDSIPGVGVEVIKIYRYGPAEMARIKEEKIKLCWRYGTVDVADYQDFDGKRTAYKAPNTTWIFIPRHPEKYGLER